MRMMTTVNTVLERADRNLDTSLERLFDLIRIKSISTDPGYKRDCRQAADWLVAQLTGLGFQAAVRDTPGHPMVVAHHAAGRDGAPHVLFYGHYDVQPVDPLNLWETDPFAPSLKEVSPGRKVITGRGAADDKGQLMTFVEACRAYKDTHGALPFKRHDPVRGGGGVRLSLAEAVPRC
jgi:acetylornithine deacetylase/succinyl-diaminopimelate desuccinylase-like protein